MKFRMQSPAPKCSYCRESPQILRDRHLQLDSTALKLVILERHAAVFKYPKWREVLRHFGLPEAETTLADLTNGRRDRAEAGLRASGTSP